MMKDATMINPDLAPEWLAEIDAWVLDVDGCLVRTRQAGGVGGTAFPGAADFIRGARDRGDAVVVCTNASERTPAEYAAHLRDLGLEVEDDAFISAGLAAAEHVARSHPGARVLPIGAPGLMEPLHGLGVTVLSADDADAAHAEVVVVGALDAVGRAELNAAALAVDAGAPLYSTVISPWFHGGHGRALTVSAAVAAAVGWASGAEPQVVGKPSPALAATLVERLGVPAERIAVVGDAPAEIQLARHAGARSITVLSGALTASDLVPHGDAAPDLAVDDIAALHHLCSHHPHR